MATYNEILGSGGGIPAQGLNRSSVLTAVIDFSEINSGNGVILNDVIQAVNIPAGTLVEWVKTKILVDEDSSNMTTFTVGDGDDTDGWGPTMVGTAALDSLVGGADTVLTEGAPRLSVGYSGGKRYVTADTIDIKNTTNATIVTGIVRLQVGTTTPF